MKNLRSCAALLAASMLVTSMPANAAPSMRINMTMHGALIADGKSHASLDVHAVDVEGKDVTTHPVITLTVASGDALIGDAGHAAAARVEVTTDDHGMASAQLFAGVRSGDVEIVAIPGDVNTDDISHVTFRIAPAQRAPFVVGLVSVGAGSMPATVDGTDAYDNGNSRRGRVAAHATGVVGGSVNGTFAYETANRLSPSYAYNAIGADPRTQSYLTCGDASTRSEDALSRQRFYARLDDGHDSLLYGEFDASTPSGGATPLEMHQLLNGVRLQLAASNNSRNLTMFTAKNDVGFGRVMQPVLGLGAISLRPNIVVGSEQVVLVALDRHTGAALTQTPLVAGVDYVLDYFSGGLRFITIPLPYDANFNPREVVVTYEYDRVGAAGSSSGGSAESDLANGRVHARVSYENLAFFGGNYTMLSQSLSGALHGGSWEFSHGASDNRFSTFPLSGDLFHGAFSTSDGVNRLFGSYDQADPNFQNPLGGYFAPGLTTLRIGYERKLARGGTLTLDYNTARNAFNDVGPAFYDDAIGLHLKSVASDRLTWHAGVHARSGNIASDPTVPGPFLGNASSSLLATLGFDWKVSKRVTLGAQSTGRLAGNEDPTAPEETDVQLGYSLPKGRVFVAQRWTQVLQQPVDTTSAVLSLTSRARSATMFGFDQTVSPAMSVTSGYVVENTLSGSDSYAILGVKEKFELSPTLHGDAFYQQGSGLNSFASTYPSTATQFSVYGLDLAYARAKQFRITTSFQNRTGVGGGTTIEGGLAGALSRDFSMVGSVSNTNLNGALTDDARVGLAWRPATSNRGSALLGFERYSSNYSVLADQTNVVSYDQVYRPSSALELAGHVAYKLDGNGFYGAHTAVFGFRATQRVTRSLDVGAEWSQLSQQISGDSQSAFAAELGYHIGPAARLGVGYSFEGAADPTLIARPNHAGVYVTFTSLVDRFFGWGRPERR